MFSTVFLGLVAGACFLMLFVIGRDERRAQNTAVPRATGGRRHLHLLAGSKP